MTSPLKQASGVGQVQSCETCVFTDQVVRESSSMVTFRARFHDCGCLATVVDRNKYIPRIHQSFEAKRLRDLSGQPTLGGEKLMWLWREANSYALKKYSMLVSAWVEANKR
jgi:hypothetical protein